MYERSAFLFHFLGGFYRFEYGPFLMVGLNSNIWYQSNKVNFTNPEDPLGQFQWLEETLNYSNNTTKKVIYF